MTKAGIQDPRGWDEAGITLPGYDTAALAEETLRRCQWIHFGAGNLFRAYPAALCQQLVRRGEADTGILAVVAAGSDTPDKVYKPWDNLSLSVTLGHEGSLDAEVIGCIAGVLRADPHSPDWDPLVRAFCCPDLQLVTFTVTEKAYRTRLSDGSFPEDLKEDLLRGPESVATLLPAVTALLYHRYRENAAPLALVSLDNCAQNGRKLRDAVCLIAEEWQRCGRVDAAFIEYVKDEALVSFPWTMIDKIVPYPSETVGSHLRSLGLVDMDIVQTGRGSRSAPYVNAEKPGYMFIEDRFPNGRPPLERAGVYFTDRETVEKVEKMKVGACLNPLHTALVLLGCLLGFATIAETMKHPLVPVFLRDMALLESMPVLEGPLLLDPARFLDEVLRERFPNPYIPDTPQRIATDTSQKIPVRFGETLKKYAVLAPDRLGELCRIPFVFACWLRYLTGEDDRGMPMELSPDPRLKELRDAVEGCGAGKFREAGPLLEALLRDSGVFGVDLRAAGLADQVLALFRRMCAGPGAVEAMLAQTAGPASGRRSI